jgi:probable HAF family extracellular repeat protein
MTVRTMTIGLSLAFAAFAFSAPAAQDAGGHSPAIVDLGTLGHDYSFAVAVNDKRQVIGRLLDDFTPFRVPFLWEDGVMRELRGTPDLIFDDARGLNDRGQIAGYASDAASLRSLAVVWEDGVLTALPTPPGDAGCGAEAINNRGDVAGTCVTATVDGPRYHAVVWRDGAIVVDLGTVPGLGGTIPIAINNRGALLGYFPTPEGSSAGFFIWKDGVLTRLDPALTAVDVNDRGQIAAWARVPPNVWIEALVIDDGRIVRLPSLVPDGHCLAAAINRRGSVGGWCRGFPVVWTGGTLRTLPGLSDFFGTVTDINDRGTAVGNATTPDGFTHAVLWPDAARHAARHVAR